MALGITIDREQHRFDSQLFPLITLTDAGVSAVIKVHNWLYLPVISSPFTLRFPNRSELACPVLVRDRSTPAFTLDTEIAQSGSVLTKDNTEGWTGAYYNTALSAVNCSVEARAMSINKSAGMSLQNGDVAITDNYTDANAVHSILFGQSGLASIREEGVLVPHNSHFRFEELDRAMIELKDGIVRYYQIKPTGDMILIRSTRSKLTAAPKAHFLLFSPLAQLQDVFIHNDDEAGTSIELVGALENFQDWKNDFFWSSTADAIQLANNDSEFTFANSKTRLRNLTPNLNMRQKRDRDDFLDFFLHHGIEKDFLFIDNAHLDRDKDPTEFWAKFTAPFGDKAMGCLSQHATQITESFRSDIVIKHLDLGTLTIELEVPEPPAEYADDATFVGLWSLNTTGRLKSIQPYVDGKKYGEVQLVDDYYTDLFYVTIKHADFALGAHSLYLIGYSYGIGADQSNTINFEFI